MFDKYFKKVLLKIPNFTKTIKSAAYLTEIIVSFSKKAGSMVVVILYFKSFNIYV